VNSEYRIEAENIDFIREKLQHKAVEMKVLSAEEESQKLLDLGRLDEKSLQVACCR